MFNKIKKAFGFSGVEDDELILDDPDISVQTRQETDNTIPESVNQAVDIHIGPEESSDVTRRIFEHVVIEFNKVLPDFIKNSVDPARQEQYLYDTLSVDIKNHLKDMEKRTMARMEKKWQQETEKLQSDLKQLQQTAKDLDTKRSNIKEQQLSTERQRRALSERVKDLENQVLTLEAQKEQYELETKSLVNKVRAAQVYEKELSEMREELNGLQSELLKERNRTTNSESGSLPSIPQEILDELERLKDVENEHNVLLETLGELEKHMDRVKSEITEKDNNIERLTKALEEASKPETNDNSEELKHLTNKLSSVQAELEIALKGIESAESRAQKAEAALKEFKETKPAPQQRSIQTFDDDILNGTDWAITTPARKQRKPAPPKKDRNDEGELSLW